MRLLLGFYFTVILIVGCDRLKNKVDDLAVQCSVPAQSTGHYLKVLDAQRQSFQGAAVKRLQADIVDAEGSKKPLSVTDGGCIRLPDEAGTVSVVDPASRQSLSLAIGVSLDSRPSVSTVRLETLNKFDLHLNCPADGLYADESLLSPENLILNGDMGGLEFHIDLYNSNKQFIRRLFDKKIGEPASSPHTSVNLSDLPEGSYSVKLLGRHVANGIDAGLALLNADKDCSLVILHGDVKVQGIDGKPFTIRAKGDPLNWKAEKFGGQLLVCKESRSGKFESNRTGLSCEPRFACKNADNFLRSDQIVTEEAGVFDYYVFARDQLGRKSPVSCQTVIVSDTSPILSVTWDAEDLKPVGSILRKPYATIRAHAAIDHAVIAGKNLEKNLECKVSFELRGRDELTGSSVYCTSGRCEGMTMGRYVPCDAEINLSLVEAWDQPLVGHSQLKLQVRSSDGVGHSTEAEASFWINKSVWQKETLSYASNGKPMNAEKFKVTKKGVVLGYFTGETINDAVFLRYVNGSWMSYPELSRYVGVQFSQKTDGTIAAYVFYYDPDEVFHNDYWEFDDDGNIAKKISIKENYEGYCQQFSIDRSARLWCFDDESVRYFANNSWHALPTMTPLRTSPLEPLSIKAWRIMSDGSIFGLGLHFVIFYSEDQGWKRLDVKTRHDLRGLVEDEQAQVWIIANSRSNGSTDTLIKIDSLKELQFYQHPNPLGSLSSSLTEAISPQLAQLQIGFYSFNFKSETWTKVKGLNSKPSSSMGFIHGFLRMDGQTNLGFQNHGFYEAGSETLYWPIKNLGENCLCETAIRTDKDQLFFLAEKSGRSELVRLAVHQAAKFDGGMVADQGTYSVDNWIDNQGSPIFALGNSRMIRLTGESIQAIPTELPKGLLRAYPLAGDRYCASAVNGVSVVHADSSVDPILTSEAGEMYFHCMEDNQGRIWLYANHAREFGYVKKDGTFQSIVDLKYPDQNLLQVQPIDSGKKILIAASGKIQILSTDTELTEELQAPESVTFLSVDAISSREYSVAVSDAEGRLFRYILDEHFNFTEDDSFEDLNLSYSYAIFQHRGDKAWMLAFAGNNQQFLLIREGAVWKLVANSDKFRPWPDMPAPLAFAPDLAGHVWFLSGWPDYTFFRYDP